MSEEQKEALRELAELCKKYKLTITSIDGRLNFRFSEEEKSSNFYAFGFDRYTSRVQKWADVEIGADD